MLRQFLVGVAASGCNIAIHALVMVVVIRVARRADELATAYQTLRLIAVMIATVTVLMIAHLAEVLVWSLIYAAIDVAPEGADLIVFRLCKLHDARLRRRDAGQALVSAWADDSHERCPVVRLVDGGDLRGVAYDVAGERRRGNSTEAGMAQLNSTHTTARP